MLGAGGEEEEVKQTQPQTSRGPLLGAGRESIKQTEAVTEGAQ